MEHNWKQLTIERLRCIPTQYKVCIGSWEGNSQEMIKEVEQESEIGLLILNVEREFLQGLKSGELQELLQSE